MLSINYRVEFTYIYVRLTVVVGGFDVVMSTRRMWVLLQWITYVLQTNIKGGKEMLAI